MATYYIGADVHSNNTELCIQRGDKIVDRRSLPTSVRAIRQVLAEYQGTLHMTLEEGPLAGWLYRTLKEHVASLVVCDPRRNRYISSDGDKDDPTDAAKLAHLLRGGYLRPVYHSDDVQRVTLKRWVALYHDRVRDATRAINKIRACCRLYGQRIPRRALHDPVAHRTWRASLEPDLGQQIDLLWLSYEANAKQVRLARRQLAVRGKPYKIIAYWSVLPGIGLIRATTLFAYLDTPWRFNRKTKVWKYCGVGLERSGSGRDRNGRERPVRLRLPWPRNGLLKNVTLGAASSAIRSRDNLFRRDYERMVSHGTVARNARHAVARKMLTVMWGMWKNQRPFEPWD